MSGTNRKDKSPKVKGKIEKSSVKIAEKSVSPVRKGVKEDAKAVSTEKKDRQNTGSFGKEIVTDGKEIDENDRRGKALEKDRGRSGPPEQNPLPERSSEDG